MYINVFNDSCGRFYDLDAAINSITLNRANYNFTLVRKRDGNWIEINYSKTKIGA